LHLLSIITPTPITLLTGPAFSHRLHGDCKGLPGPLSMFRCSAKIERPAERHELQDTRKDIIL